MASVRLLRRVALADLRTRLSQNINSEASCGVAMGGRWTRRSVAGFGQVSLFSSTAARPDAGHIVPSPFQDLALPSDISLMGHLFDDFGQYGDITAVIDGTTGRRMTYTELQSDIVRVGSALWRLGIRKGDVVVLCSENIPEFLVAYLSLAAVGAVISCVNPAYTPGELAHVLTHVRAKLLFASAATIELAKQAANVAKLSRQDIVVFGEAAGCRPFSTLLQDDGKCFPENLDWEPQEDLVALPFSSGTTGLPKGVMLTHYNLVANIDQTRTGDVMGYVAGEDVLMGVLPWFHIYGQTVVALAGLKAGAAIVSMPKFLPELFLKIIKDYKITFLHIVPPIMLFLAKHPMVNVDDFPSVKCIISGAAPCGANSMAEVRDRLNIPQIRQGYGLTETSPLTHVNPRENYRYDTCGPAVPNTSFKIVDVTTGEMLERRSEGEVCIRGPQVMKGYLDNEKATRETLKDGWLHTGDFGFADDDGHLVITDRIKEMIKYKGLQVAPAELEALLLTHPAVTDSAVIGQPDERVGEVPRAYVVLRPNLRVSQDELQKFIAEQVAPYKQLRGGIEFRQEIPKSASGKILRRVLKDELAEESRRK